MTATQALHLQDILFSIPVKSGGIERLGSQRRRGDKGLCSQSAAFGAGIWTQECPNPSSLSCSSDSSCTETTTCSFSNIVVPYYFFFSY